MQVRLLEWPLEEKYKNWFSAFRLKSHKVQMLKKDDIAAKESTQSVRERNRYLDNRTKEVQIWALVPH